MEINLYLLLSLLIALLVISYLLGKLHRVRGQLFLIRDALNDIKAGNLNRRVLTRESDLTKQICYDINEIAMSSQSRLIQQKQSEQAYKRLMTSLSHDVKTPLASLVGYLEAVESKMVTGAEQEEYIRVAMEKAHHLKDFVTALFEWVKLDAGEHEIVLNYVSPGSRAGILATVVCAVTYVIVLIRWLRRRKTSDVR